MTEFQELVKLVKDAPKFASMERGELVAYAYGIYAAGAKTDAENAQLRDQLEEQKCFAADLERDVRALRELVRDLVHWHEVEHKPHEELRFWGDKSIGVYARMRKLGIEVEP